MAEWHELLACPHCRGSLSRGAGALLCDSGHAFDIARQGYVNLLPGDARIGTADTAEMVNARSAFLGAGHYAPLVDALARTVEQAVAPLDGCIVDVGAGTGDYLAAVLEHLPEDTGLALDISKHAARRAARASERIGAVVCDAWGELPVRDGVAAAVLNVFAPRNAAEFARVLKPDGVLVVASPTGRHLAELVGPLGMVRVDPDKEDRIESALSPYFMRHSVGTVEAVMALTRASVVAAARMGPSAHHADRGEMESRVAALDEPVVATLSAAIGVWKLKGE